MARPIAPDTVARRDDDLDPNGPIPVGMKRTRSGRLKRRNILWRLRKVLLGLVVVAVLSASGASYTVWSKVDLPKPPDPLQKSYLCPLSVGDRVCDGNTAFAELGTGDAGIPVTRADIPDVFVKALVAAEDKDFYNHSGVDPTGIARALYRDLRGGGGQQGGSTITQQYIKNAYDDDAPTISRKVKEAVQAVKLEQKYGKDEILTRYLNEIYFGRNAQGLGAAVRAYFGDKVEVKNLTLEMAAYLAAIIREPEFADANRDPAVDKALFEKQRKYATVRRAQVLDAMVAQGFITEAERERAAMASFDYVTVRGARDQGAVRKDAADVGGGYWQNYVKQWLVDSAGISAERLATEGLRVYTTFDVGLQGLAYQSVKEVLPNSSKPEASMAVIDEKGFIRAMVGGRDPLGGLVGLNLATQASKPPGSSFKPIALAAYLSQPGKSLADKFPNPLCLELPDEPDLCSIKGEETPYPIDLVQATAISSNTVFGQLQQQQRVEHNRSTIELAKSMGIPEGAIDPASEGSVRVGLGATVRLAPLHMATAFSVLARQGEQIGPYPVLKVTDAKGRIIYQAPQKHERVLQPEVVDQVNYALTQVIDDDKGTGHKETRVMNQQRGYVAGKTGSMAYEENNKPTKDSTDAWFVGYNCRLTAAVWMGMKDSQEAMGPVEDVQYVNGGTLPARIFSHFMGKAMFLLPPCAGPYPRPKSAEPPPPAPTQPTWPKRGDDDGGKEDGGRPEPDNRWWTWPWATTTTVAPELPTTTRRDQRPTTTRRRGPGAQPAEPPPEDVDAATTPEDPRAGRASP